nr:hypothetical protein OG546_26255 [Streptomyces antimycoticus]
MPGIPDAISVASPDTHCLIVAVPHDGPAEISSSLPRPVAADVLRQIADQLEAGASSCARALATGKPCPVHDRPASPSADLLAAGTEAPAAFARGMRDAQRPDALDSLLDHLADRMPDGEQPSPNLFPVDSQQVEHAQQQLGEAFATFGRKLRTALEQAAATMQQYAEQAATEPAEGEQQADDDPRPRIEVDLEPAAAPEPITAAPATPERVRCTHNYWLMQDSCPGCDAEQETPHEADPVAVRPRWAKGDMRRCRRCALVPSHAIHRAPRTTK